MGTTDKKKKEATGSVDNDSGNSSADASASLQARRAKLRGALGGRSTSYPDPFTAAPPQEPFSAPTDPYANQSNTYSAQQDPYTATADPYQSANPYLQNSSTFGGEADPYTQAEQQEFEAADPYGLAAEANYDYSTEENEPPVNVYGVPITAESIDEATAELEGKTEPDPIRPSRSKKNTSSLSTPAFFEAAPPAPVAIPAPTAAITGKTAELVESIDQSLNICATNLAALQNLSGEQTNVLRGLAQTLQNQTLLEIGLNLNSLTESLTAALEPMKAIGELVPALDSLVTALEGKENQSSEKLSPDQLVTSLADQLSAGLIDPWTFKCAYMAVYPADPPAELLHRLVELLGQQRISGDLFRAAYEAVQAAEAPSRSSQSYSGSSGEYTGGSLDENVRAQLDGLERSNREMQRRLDEREQELTQILSQKEGELQVVQDQLSQRLEELNNRYSDAADMIHSKEEEFRSALESKDMDLIEKDAELNMLRNQMEELRSQTEEMVRDLQKEMTSLRHQVSSGPAPAQEGSPAAFGQQQPVDQSFFDNKPSTPRPGLFEPAPAAKPAVFASDPGGSFDGPVTSEGFGADSGGFGNSQFQNPQQQSQPGFAPPQAPTFQPPQPTFQPQAPQPAPQQPARPPQQQASSGPGPSPPTTPFGGQSGSYGMGVRQQVFEVIVRQALAGAPWREICAGPMQVNNISPDEVEAEVKRRQSLLNK